MTLEEIQNNLLFQIKTRAQEINSVESLTELFDKEKDVYSLFESFILAKNLYKYPYSNNEKHEESSNDIKEIDISPKIDFSTIEEVTTNEVETENRIVSINLQTPKDEKLVEQEKISFKPLEKIVASQAKNSVKSINLDLNDHFAFVSQLFKGNTDEFNTFILKLNNAETFSDSKIILNAAKTANSWSINEEEFVARLEILNEQRFI